VTLHDRRRADLFNPEQLKKIRENGISVSLGDHYLDDLKGDIIFRTPGLPFNTNQLIEAMSRGQVVTSELEVFMELCPCPVYGVTGSDGKTTTSSLLANMLESTGRMVLMGGNIGKPLLPILDKVSQHDLCVVELSSFQLLSMRSSPDVAVITNISPNHLDVHRDMDEYIFAKCNIIDHQNAFSRAVLSADNDITLSLSKRVRGHLSYFSRSREVSDGGWMDEKGNLYHSTLGPFDVFIEQERD
jgi:UDP-N-acetylmuramoylalanine--D-glutamate ligase